MSMLSLRVALAASLVMVAACEPAPTSPAHSLPPARPSTSVTDGQERQVEERLSDFTGALVAYPCGDGYTEMIRMEGQVFTRYTFTRDASGGLHALTQFMPVGLRGIGLTSGAEYKITEREHGTFNQGAMGQTASTYKSYLNASAPSIHARARLVLGGMFVVNANGELIIERPVLQADCQS
jgi:hypothetical protein